MRIVGYDPKIHHRRSIRLKQYDYSKPGWYFVTICVHGKKHMLGEVIEGELSLTEAGQIVQRAWQVQAGRFPEIVIDEFVVMPNHFHGVVHIVGVGLAPPRMGDVGAGLAPPMIGDVGAGLALPQKGRSKQRPYFGLRKIRP